MSESIVRQKTISGAESRPQLQPFRGLLSPGIAFESGHTVWLFKFTETPFPVEWYYAVWLESPEGDLTLYLDPAEASDFPPSYHHFDQIVGAMIDWHLVDFETVEVSMKAVDGRTLSLRANLTSTVGTRIMEILARVTPARIQRSPLGAKISSALLNHLIPSNGLKLLGRTETGVGYWAEAESLRAVRDVSVTLDGTDLGKQVPGTASRYYGDVKTVRDPFVVFGALHLEYPVQGQHGQSVTHD